MKCQCCKEQEAEWAWQPFGPGETANEYALPGSHTRGFPVVKVCDSCKRAFQTGDFPVRFEYKGFKYVAKDHNVSEVDPHLWDGGKSTFASARGDGVMIMKDAPGDSELVAIVCDDQPAFVHLFIAAPDLMAACEQVATAFEHTAEYRLDSAQHLAIASVHAALASARGER